MSPTLLLRRRATAAICVLIVLGACGSGAGRDSPPGRAAASEAQPLAEAPVQPPAENAAPAERSVPSPPVRTSADLAIYSFDPLRGRLVQESTVAVPPAAGRDLALEILLARINDKLVGRRIQTAEVRTENEREILVLDLVDLQESLGVASWYASFQGSSGGSATQAFLVVTFLQPLYAGDWFEAVRFLLNGQPMTEMDHVDLSGLFLRSRSLKQYGAPLPEEPAGLNDQEILSFLRNSLELPGRGGGQDPDRRRRRSADRGLAGHHLRSGRIGVPRGHDPVLRPGRRRRPGDHPPRPWESAFC